MVWGLGPDEIDMGLLFVTILGEHAADHSRRWAGRDANKRPRAHDIESPEALQRIKPPSVIFLGKR